MIERAPTKADFLRHVEGHKLIVHSDDGINRHLTFRRPETINRYFNITTWPGYLTISGDMGCYVFARLPDMFEFFREKEINPSYWGEKLQAISRTESYRVFSESFYRRAVVSDFKAYYPPGTPGRMEAWKDFRWEFLDHFAPSSVSEAVEAVHSYRDPFGRSKFQEFWDHNLEDYSYHFIWCCRAIQWAVERYDEHKADERFPGLARIHAEHSQEAVAA